MNEIHQLADQILIAYKDGFWDGGSIRNLSRSFQASQAALYPIPGAHSTWEIALHISAWHNIFHNRLMDMHVEYHYDNDWPDPGPPSEQNRNKTLDELDNSIYSLVNTIHTINPDELKIKVPGREFTFFEMVLGIAQHDQYHAGQVRMFKKIIFGK